jgi:hypothetical protein
MPEERNYRIVGTIHGRKWRSSRISYKQGMADMHVLHKHGFYACLVADKERN